jgi:2-dehydro-3-deoxyphosphogluconate aldolase / (4S)-4-hydroxy-2-oxoglutarate aldolase
VELTDVVGRISALRLVPVVVVHDAHDAQPLAEALKAGGLGCAEITFRSAAAVEAIRAMADDKDTVVGAGTVLKPRQLEEALDAGAKFIVTPGFSGEVVRLAREASVPVFPGVATATEIQMALDEGVETVKFFPAEAMGGVATLKALAGPFPMVRFIPTGGITAGRLSQYLELKSVLAVGGSWMVAPDLLADGRFDEVRRLAAEAMEIAQTFAPRPPKLAPSEPAPSEPVPSEQAPPEPAPAGHE